MVSSISVLITPTVQFGLLHWALVQTGATQSHRLQCSHSGERQEGFNNGRVPRVKSLTCKLCFINIIYLQFDHNRENRENFLTTKKFQSCSTL